MQCNNQHPLFMMGDFNCSIGTVESDFIGGVGAEFEDFAGSQLRQLCQRFRLWVPSTKDGLHVGPSWTHMNVHGTCHRLDYILVAEQCCDGIIESKVEYDMDVLNGDKDHKVVRLTMELKISYGGQTGMKRTPLYDRDEARSFCHRDVQSLFTNMPLCRWSCDTNEHWSNLREHAQSECVRWFPKKKRTQRQLYFSEHAWNMLCHRKDLRQEHRALQQKRRLHDLKFFFSGWKDRGFSHENADAWTRSGHLFNLQEAVVLEARRNVDVKFKHIKKVEWRQWVRQCLDQNVSALQQAKVNEVHKILKPKRMVDKKKSGGKRPLPGFLDRHGMWQTSPSAIAVAWQKQFSEIENATETTISALLAKSSPCRSPITDKQLEQIPTLYELEQSIRNLDCEKAPGLDSLGAEVWQADTASTSMRVFPLLLKSAVRRQAIAEHAGGWILPLYKGKGPPCKMQGYRAILLEPTLARIFSRTWRSRLVDGLANVAADMQWGGRQGIGINPLHLQVRMWQSNAKHCQKSLSLIFIDLKTAFYSVVKPMLASFDGSDEAIVSIFQMLKLPPSAYQAFLENIGHEDLILQATRSELLADCVGANLASTWFAVPNGTGLLAPQTGSRPGDPCADILFGFIMAQVLKQIHHRAQLANIPLRVEVQEGVLSNCLGSMMWPWL